MLKYITETGIFGILWITLTLIFPFITYRFIKRNSEKFIPTCIPIVVGLLLMNITATELINKSRFDISLTMIRDIWFLMYHVIFMSAFIMVDRDLMDNLIPTNSDKCTKEVRCIKDE